MQKCLEIFLTWHQILEFTIKFLRIISFFCIATIVQFQNDAQHNTASIGNNSTGCTFQANTFGLMMLLPCIFLTFTIAIVDILATWTFQHFTAVNNKNEKANFMINETKTKANKMHYKTHLRMAGAQAKITSFGTVCWF